MTRRKFLSGTATGIALAALPAWTLADPKPPARYRAILFDAFPIFDPRPVFALVEELFPGHGSDLSAAWKTRQFEYTWLRTLVGRYVDFPTVTRDALVFAAKSLKLELKPDQEEQLLRRYFQLKAWPDVVPALTRLKAAGIKFGFLSNFSEGMLTANLKSAGLEGRFDQVLSTDRIRAFKPDPRAYQVGLDAMNLKREEMLFAAFAGWDAAGAKSFGYPTFWVNRQNALEEELGVHPDGMGEMAELIQFVGS